MDVSKKRIYILVNGKDVTDYSFRVYINFFRGIIEDSE